MTQTYLLNLFYSKYVHNQDKTFVKNFWKSLINIDCPESVTFQRVANIKDMIRYINTEGIIKVDKECRPMMGRLEPPSIFKGRDELHPLRGTCKRGVEPKDVILNMSRNATTRARQAGFTTFVERKEFNWIACWKDSLTGTMRYIYLNNESPEDKFETARRLCRKYTKMRAIYKTNPSTRQDKQFLIALYFIDHCCIRVGHKKDESSQGNTVGCCTLRAHTHVRKISDCHVHIEFVGKDSIKYDKVIHLPKELYSFLCEFLHEKTVGDLLFDTLNPMIINRLLHERIMPGVTARTFRTMHASLLFESVLRKYNDVKRANTEVAILLNHKTHNGHKLNLQTSRNNYIDPRIYFAYRTRMNDNTLRKMFDTAEHWAGQTPGDYKFKK